MTPLSDHVLCEVRDSQFGSVLLILLISWSRFGSLTFEIKGLILGHVMAVRQFPPHNDRSNPHHSFQFPNLLHHPTMTRSYDYDDSDTETISAFMSWLSHGQS